MGLISDMHEETKPREKFLEYGPQGVSEIDLLAILIRTGYRGKSALDVARDVFSMYKGEEANILKEGNEAYMGRLANINVNVLKKIKGIGTDKAITICAAIELGRRLMKARVKHTFADFSNPEAVAKFVMEHLRYAPEEHFQIALLNIKNGLIKVENISIGGLSTSMAEQRTVFRLAVEAGAASIILIHNHPSGDPEPSQEDVNLTRVFVEAGVMMGIPVLDHIIIGDGRYISLRKRGYI